MYPVATALCARLLLGEKLSGAAYAIIAVMTAGLLLMNSAGAGVELNRPFLILAATLPMIGLADVYARKTLLRVSPTTVTAGRLTAGSLFVWLLMPMAGSPDWPTLGQAWAWILIAGLATAGGVLFLYRAMDVAGASLAAAFAGLAPVVTAASERALLGASYSNLQLAGMLVVVAGAVALGFVLDGRSGDT